VPRFRPGPCRQSRARRSIYAVWSGDDAEADDLGDAEADDLGDAEADDLGDAEADDLGDAEADDLGDADELNLAMSVVTDHTRTVIATRTTNPKQASTRAFRRALGSGRWPAD